MPNPNFLQPSINKIVEQDPMIQKVNLEYQEWGARKSTMDRTIVNSMTIEHVGSMNKGN